MEPARRLVMEHDLYDELCALPERLTGEILNGQLYTQPRPTGMHMGAETALSGLLFGPYHRGMGGPGGWRFVNEPEIHFVRDTEVAVPDLGGWRRERLPLLPKGHRFEVVPDWICEILSPSTESKDREIKMPLYHHYGVKYVWLVDPRVLTLEAFEAGQDGWNLIGQFNAGDRVSVAPFTEAVFTLSELWD